MKPAASDIPAEIICCGINVSTPTMCLASNAEIVMEEAFIEKITSCTTSDPNTTCLKLVACVLGVAKSIIPSNAIDVKSDTAHLLFQCEIKTQSIGLQLIHASAATPSDIAAKLQP